MVKAVQWSTLDVQMTEAVGIPEEGWFHYSVYLCSLNSIDKKNFAPIYSTDECVSLLY